ncbi:MAG: PEP/pyruvate-binding domain-containing protein [Endomicrobiaceae bacterium]|nr:PEP/pyruvate-binding domain-containing protein [Endomicrobiaceae bacterium]
MEQVFNKLRNKVIIKFIAAVTSVCFIFTGVFVDVTHAVIINKQERQSAENSQTFITLPSIGLVTTAMDFNSPDIIINIQDLHSHPQTQRNIAKIISYLDSKYKLEGLFLEGAYGDVDTKWLSRMGENELGKQMIEDLVDAGQLGGVEYYSAINNRDSIIKGIEDKNIYEENIKLLNEIIDLQPEINSICHQMEKEIETVKKDYFNRDTDKLDKLVKRYRANKISANKYYEKLSKLAKKSGVDLNKYENVKAYVELLVKAKNLNLEKISQQFKVFINILKSNIEYGRYSELSKISNNFQDIENIVSDLKDIAEKNKIFETHKFTYLKNFFTYLEFNKKVNLIGFVKEEKQLLNELYTKLSENKYEQEVAFLYEFVPTIKEYFGANITADDYLSFREDFKKFRIVWNSYFPENTSKQLYKYEQLLSKYHSNNIKRDGIFADKLLGNSNNNTNIDAAYGQDAIAKLQNEIGYKKIKVIVTGGFHSQGLEQIARERKISYIQITPKITKDISRAGKTHWNTIRGYRQVLDNTINAKPLTETWVNVLFPEILTRALTAVNEIPEFAQLNSQQQKRLIQETVDEALKSRNYNDNITVVWKIEELEKNKAKITATYIDQSDDKEKKYNEEYIFNGKSLQTVGQNDANNAPQKLNKSTESVQSILNNLFKNTKTFWYKLYTTLIAPVWEEFVFRFIPFAIAGSIAATLPISITAFAITAVVSIIAFSYAHTMADKLRAKKDKQTIVRDWKNFLIPSAIFTGLYVATFIAVSIVLPGIGSYLIALAISTFGHSMYNKLALEGKIKKPVANVLEEHYSQISKTIKQLKDDILNDRAKTVCFVCTGNTDRSPVAEMLFKSLMRKTGKQNIKVKSAGLNVVSSDFIMPLKYEHKAELKKYNVDDDILDGFKTEKLTKEHLQSDYFIVVGTRHKQGLIDMGVPQEKIIMFKDLSPELVSGELPDPYGNFELRIRITALINQIFKNNFSPDSLLKEPEEIQELDMTMIFDLINSLKNVTVYRFQKDIAEIIGFLSQITQDTPADKKNNIIFEQLTALKQMFRDPKDFLFLKLVPLATIVKNPQTNKPVLNEFIDLLIKEKEKIDSSADLYSDMWVNNQYSNFRSSAINIFELAYPVNNENALEIIKMLKAMDFVDNKEIPWGLRDIIKKYQDVKKYFMAISEPGVDKDMLKGLKKTVEMLKNIKLQNEEPDNEKALIIENLNSLVDVINPSTAQIVDNQIQELLLIVSKLLKSDKTEDAIIIIKSVLPVCEQMVLKTNMLNEKTLKDLYSISEQLYNMNEKEGFAIIVSYLLFVAESSVFEDSTRTNERACEYLGKITSTMYNSIKNLEKNSGEYIKTENEILTIFKKLAENSPENIAVYRQMFDNLGFNTKTLSVLITALDNSGQAASPYIPADEKIMNSKDIIDLIIKSTKAIVIERLCLKLYVSGANGKKMALNVINKLFEIAEDSNEKIELRKTSAILLGRISSLVYKYINDDKIINIDRINNLYNTLNVDSMLEQSTVYLENIYGRRGYGETYAENFDFTPLIAKLPKSVIAKEEVRLKSPVYMENRGRINRRNKEVVAMTDDFDSLQDILRYNVIVLERIKKLNDRSSRKDFDKTVEVISRMIEVLKKINVEHGTAAEIALNKILKLIPQGVIENNIIKKQVALSKWKTSNISDIEELHTLINAIHQTSILDFKQKVQDISSMDKGHIRTSKFTRDETTILAYDLSDSGKMNRDIQSFLTRLASDRVSIDDFVFRDDILVWTTRLFAHSVDIFINFGENDRGIAIYYNENGRKPGYAERVRYFSEVLKRLGFDVVSDTEYDYSDKKPGTCGLKAVLNKDLGLNEETDIVEIAARAILLYKHSTNLDMELEEIADRYSRDSYMTTLSKLVDKFMAGEIWYGYSYVSNGRTAFREHTMTERFPKPSFSEIKQMLDEMLLYLGLEKIPDGLSRKYYEFEQSVIDKYFNTPIEQAYDEGRIILDDNGYLVKNENYDMMELLINAILDNEYDTLRQSRIINLISRSKFNFKTVGFIGNLMFVTGNMKLSNGESLSVRGLMNPYTRRFKYARAEVISSAARKHLSNTELVDILNAEGYEVSSKQQLIGQKERDRIKGFLNAQIQNTDSPEILCTGTSDGKGTYVAGNITFDRNNVGENDILLVPFTIPDDIKAIESSKAVITTGGGILSHAAITTRELQKPSVVLNGASWKDGYVDITYYTSVNDVETIKGFQVRKVKENNFMLKNGTKVLVNGETGRILLFNDINAQLLEELQDYIESNDVESIKIFIDKNKDNENIKRLVEYIYFQSIGNKELEDIMFVLFDDMMPDVVKEKIKELNSAYVQDKIRSISESIANLKHVDNINIEYSIIVRLNNKLNFIRTIGNRDDMESLKKDVTLIQMEIKDKLLDYVLAVIMTGRTLLAKKTLTSSDIGKIVKLLHQISVFRYFVPKSEKRRDLLDARVNLEALVEELANTVKEFQKNKEVQINCEICNFNEISIEDINRFGSKTTELSTMYKLLQKTKGVKVPAGVGISANVLEMFFYETGKGSQYKKLSEDFESAIKEKDFTNAKKIAKNIQNLIETGKTDKKTVIQQTIENKIKNALQQGARYSVRSSGVGEDSGNKAFAGMGETKLNVGYDEIFDNIKECWESFYSDRCIDYMIESGQVVKPAVLIQEMINVDNAGVIFSRNKYGNTTIEALYGLGEGIVSGALTPDTVEVDTASGEIIEYSVADKYVKIVATDNGTKQQIVTEGAKERVLDVATVKRLMDVVKTLEKDAGYPIDIEYGIKDDDIYILQRRPITTFEDATQEKVKEVIVIDKKPVKQMATIVFENIPAGQEVLFNIANPSVEDEAISVYLKKTDGDIAVFCIDSKYLGNVHTGIVISAIVDRINTDSVVRDRFNSNLSIIARIGEMEMGILPFHYIDSDKKINLIEQDTNIQHIKTMLMSA